MAEISETTPLCGTVDGAAASNQRYSSTSSDSEKVEDLGTFREDPVPPFSWSQKKLLAVLSLVSMLSGSLAALMFPFFPAEASRRGLSQTLISGVFSCFAATQLASYPLLARLTPAVGVHRLYSAGLATAAITTIVFGTLEHIQDPTIFICACFAVRMVEAFGAAAITTCAYTMVSSCMPDRASTAVGYIAAGQSVGLAIAPAVGGGLFALGGFGVPFYVLGVLMLITSAANTRLLPDVCDAHTPEGDFLRRLWTLAGSGEAWVCCCVVTIYSAAFSTFGSCLSPYAMSALNMTPPEIGLLFLVASSAYALVSVLWGRLLEPLSNPYYIMSGCLLLASFSLILMPPWPALGLHPSRWLMGGAMLLHEVAFAGPFAPCLKLLNLTARLHGLPDSVATRALISSVFGAAFALGLVVGPVSGGALVDWVGFPAMMAVLAAVTAAVALLVLGQGLLVTLRGRSSEWDWEDDWEEDKEAGKSAHDVGEAVP